MGKRGGIKQRQRMQALEYVIANPGAIARDVIDALSWAVEPGGKRLHLMCVLGELRREPIIVPSGVTNRPVRTYQYWAEVETVLDASDVAGILKDLRGDKETTSGASCPPGVTRNTDPNRKPIQNQDGGQLSGYGPRGFSSCMMI